MPDAQNQLGRIEAGVEELVRNRKDHEFRLRALELMAAQAQGGWKIVAVLVAVSGAIGGCASWAISHFKP